MDFFLADDLSGALDAAAAFHHAGRRVRVVLTRGTAATVEPDEVMAITTETRNAAPAAAADAVREVLEDALARGGRLLFKKIDSTLRGPVVAELSALLRAMPEMHVLFTPANPAVGRIVRDGVLQVHGVPVAQTDFGRDPVNPVRESSLWKLLGPVANERVHVADAERQRDLDSAVAEMNALGQPWVGVGSGALARAVAAQVDPESVASAPSGPHIAAKSTLMICGSAHAANRLQAECLWRERDVPVHEVTVASGAEVSALLLGREGATLMIEAVRSASAAALKAITTTAKEAIERNAVQRLFVTGGETAFAICGALGISSLAYLEEIEAGVCLASAETMRGPILLAVKPGGFGDAGTWVRVWDRLKAG